MPLHLHIWHVNRLKYSFTRYFIKVDVDSPVEIKNITLDSRDAISGSIFVAIKGYKLDGHNFIEQAVSNGASVIVLENSTSRKRI